MKERTKGKLAAFVSGGAIGYIFGAWLKRDRQIGEDAHLTIGTLGVYLGAMAFITLYAKSKLLGALWAFWLLIAIAITWSL